MTADNTTSGGGVLIDIWPVWSQIRGGSYVPWKEIDRVCSYFPKNAPYSKAFQQRRWDGITHLYRNGKFPTGLLANVRNVLIKHGIPFKQRIHFSWPQKQYGWWLKDKVQLRQRHIEAVHAAMLVKRGLLQLPTRFGKTTVVASATIAGFGVPTLFIAHQLDLIYDAKKVFEQFLDGPGEIGVIGGGQCTYKPLTVACIDSLHSRLKDYGMQKYLHEVVKYIIVDETQFFGPGEYKEVVYQCEAPYRLFMSATAERNDGADLELQAASGPLIYSLTEEEMIEEGYISDVRVEMIPFDHGLFNKNATGLDYSQFYDECITFNEDRNNLIISETLKLLETGNPTLIIVRRIDHGNLLKERLINAGVRRVEFISGELKNGLARIKLRDEFNAGKYDILIGSTVFDTAQDLHRATGLVIAAGGSSKIRTPQRVGRVLSQVMGKTALVKDIKDMNVKYFEDDAKERQRRYISRYGDSRVKVRGAGPLSELEKIMGIDSSKLFDKLP